MKIYNIDVHRPEIIHTLRCSHKKQDKSTKTNHVRPSVSYADLGFIHVS